MSVHVLKSCGSPKPSTVISTKPVEEPKASSNPRLGSPKTSIAVVSLRNSGVPRNQTKWCAGEWASYQRFNPKNMPILCSMISEM